MFKMVEQFFGRDSQFLRKHFYTLIGYCGVTVAVTLILANRTDAINEVLLRYSPPQANVFQEICQFH